MTCKSCIASVYHYVERNLIGLLRSNTEGDVAGAWP